MFKTLFRASLLLAPAVTAIAATPSADLDELHQRQFRYARAMMQLNQIEGFERGPSIDALLRQEREAKAKRAEERWRDSADVRAQSMDEFAKAVERVASEQRAKRTMSRQWQIDEPYPSHWSVSGNEAAAADCARAIEHPLGQPLRIEMSRDGVAWLRVVAPGKGYWAFDTLVSEFDTKLSVYRDCRDIGAESKQISDDTVGLGSIVGLDAKTAGQTFLIKLERKGGVGSLAIAKSVLAGSISGRVRAAETGAGIRYAVVSFFRSDGANQASLTTNEEGVYSATLYEPGNYYLRARGPDSPYGTTGTEAGYSAGAYPSASCASISDFSIEFCSGEVSAISVLDDSNISDIDLSLHRGGSISGVISAELGGAIPNASIFAILAEDAGEQVTRRMATSDAGGRYRLDDLPPGGWRVEFAHPEHQSERWNDVACTGGLPNACAAGAGNPIETSVDSSFRADAALRADAYIRFRITREGEAAYQGGAFVYDASGQEVGYEYCYQTPCVVSVGPLTPGYYRAKLGASDSYYLVYGGANCIRYCDNSELLAGQLIEVTAQNKVQGSTPFPRTV